MNVPYTDEKVNSRFCRRFPNAVVRDARLTPEALAMLAYRCTWVSDKAKFGLWEEKTAGLVRGRGFGINVRRRAIADAKRLGYLYRPKNASLGRTEDGHFRRAVDKLTLPSCEDNDGRVIKRSWFDGSLTLHELAAWLFIRAGTGKGARTHAREIAKRFGWSRRTTARALAGLLKRKLINEKKTRKADGTFNGLTYADVSLRATSEIKTTLKEPCNGEPCGGSPGDGEPCSKRRVLTLDERKSCNASAVVFDGVVACARDDNDLCDAGADDRALIDLIRDLDRPKAVKEHLLKSPAIADLRKRISEHGFDRVRDAVAIACGRALTDGLEPGFIKSWRYLDGIISDIEKREAMSAQGVRPGDLGNWRGALVDVPF
jgi:hypothetical protein